MSNNNIGRYFSQFYRKGRAYYAKELKKFGIGSGQSVFLFQLFKEDGVNQETLAEIIYMDKGTTARAIQKLEEQGLVTRVEGKDDKRSKIVYLTEKGRALEGPITEIMKQWDREIIKDLTEEEIVALRKIIEKISDSHSMK